MNTHRISSCEGRSILDHRQFNTRRAYHDTHTKWPFHSSSSTSRSPSIPTPSPASMYASSLASCSHSGASRSISSCAPLGVSSTISSGSCMGSANSASIAVAGDDDGGGAVSEDRTRPSTSSMQFPRRSSSSSTICKGKVNERTNQGGEAVWNVQHRALQARRGLD